MTDIFPDIIFIEKTESTNTFLKNILSKKKLQNFTVAYTHNQTKGRGQRNKIWISEPYKNLLCSIYYNATNIGANSLFYLNKCIALSITEFVSEQTDNLHVNIKWANDIIISDGKISGILIENFFSDQHIQSIIGIGVNINQEHFPVLEYKAVSLKNLTGKDYDILNCLNKLMIIIIRNITVLQNKQHKIIDSQYNNLLLYKNEIRNYKINNQIIQAKILAVDESGKLIIENIKNNTIMHLEYGQLNYI